MLERMEKLALLTLTFILMFSTLPNASITVKATSPIKGPRTEDLIIYFYGNISSAYSALKTAKIDIVGFEIPKRLYEDAIADSNIVLAPVSDSGMYEFDINNNCTIATYPGIRSPTHYQGFRQALAWLTDKDYIVDEICGGFAERIDQPIAAPYKSWRNASYWYPNYPYEYDPQAAADALDAAGFVQGSTPNPYYDPAFPGSAEYIRTYPAGHSKAGQDLDPLEFVIRTDDIRRFEAGRLVASNLKKHGVPVTQVEGDIGAIYDKVFGDFNYHIYTGGWSVGRFPPITLYLLYCHKFWYPYGPNYVTGVDCNGNPNYPKLCELLYDAWLGLIPNEEMLENFKKTVGYFTEQCITIPLWSSRSYWALSKNLLGVVNMEVTGPENGYTFMNAYKTDGSAIRFGIRNAPNAMNVVYSDWYYDTQNLDRMNLYSGIDVPPYDLSIDQAGFVRDWETSTWEDDGVNKTKVTRWFRDDCYFVEPVTGNQKARANASQYFFTAWYLYQLSDAWWSAVFDDIHHIDIVNDFQVDIYFNTLSYWNNYYAYSYMLPMDLFLKPPFTHNTTKTFVEGINLTTPGPVNLTTPIWIDSVTVDGTPLNMFTEYNIVGRGLGNAKLEIFTNLTDGAVVVVDYWYLGARPGGYTPGDLPWQTIFEGAGMYYAVDFQPGVGGFLALKKNPYYWMETPMLGDIDFIWKWEDGPKPRNGSYNIDIFDIVLAAGAYGTQGTGVPDKNWFPGADIVPYGGRIEIFDIVTISSKYGAKWG